MPFIYITILLCSALFLGAPSQSLAQAENPDFIKEAFKDYDANGTIVIEDQRNNQNTRYIFNKERAEKRYAPASTYKIPHALFALDSGAVHDENQIFKWDGIERSFPSHNQDQTLRTAIQRSVIWVFEEIADKIGPKQSQAYVEKIQYGNEKTSGTQTPYWIYGDLKISAMEEIVFLKKLRNNTLPFSKHDLETVKDIIKTDITNDIALYAKTGWQGKYGWWVGWVEHTNGPVYFALNIDTPKGKEDLFKRQAITKQILQKINAIPSEQ